MRVHAETSGCPLVAPKGSLRKVGVPYFGVPITRILLFRVLYEGPLIFGNSHIWPLKLCGPRAEKSKMELLRLAELEEGSKARNVADVRVGQRCRQERLASKSRCREAPSPHVVTTQ